MNHHIRAGTALVVLCGCAAVQAQPLQQPDGGTWQVEAGVQHRGLRERAASGSALVHERGPMATLGLHRRFDAYGVEAHVGVAHGRLRYQGRTQSGTPLSTHTTHTDLEAGLRWSPWEPRSWGELQWGVDALRNRRSIQGTGSVGGLVETSTWVLPAVQWRSSILERAGLSWQASARLRASVHERLEVDFGGAYDPATLASPTRRDAELRLDGWGWGDWRWSLAWTHAMQHASPELPLYRGGTLTGTVRQPELRIDDLQLSLKRTF